MKKVLLLNLIFILVMTGTVFAFQYGPAEPTAKEGKAAVSAGYFYYNGKWELSGNSYDMVQQNAYVQGNVGLFKNWEVYGRLGGANMKVKELFTSSEDFNDTTRLFGGAGIKGLIYRDKTFGVGPFGQVNYYTNYKDDRTVAAGGGTGMWNTKLKDFWDITVGVAFQAKLSEGLLLYGGPFAYWAQVTADISSSVPGQIFDTSRTLKEKNNVGGFLGLRLPFTKKVSFDVEGQLKSQVSVGAALTYSF